MRPLAASIVALAALLVACGEGAEDARDQSPAREVMRAQPDVPLETVPRGTRRLAESLAAPGPAVTPALLTRGQERFAVFCMPCHGRRGHGDGVIVSRGFPMPPSYHQERLRNASAEHIVSVITHGKGAMYGYAERVPPDDRWAIAHHVKRLQGEEAPPAPEAAP